MKRIIKPTKLLPFSSFLPRQVWQTLLLLCFRKIRFQFSIQIRMRGFYARETAYGIVKLFPSFSAWCWK